MDWTLLFAIGGCIFGLCGLFYGLFRRPRAATEELLRELSTLPSKVLQALKSSTSNMKGAMAEHIAFLQLSSQYDRLIPIGDVVDFIGIKFDTKKDSFDGAIHFIEVKTGGGRLTHDQIRVKRIANGGRTKFIKVKINTDYDNNIEVEPDAFIDS